VQGRIDENEDLYRKNVDHFNSIVQKLKSDTFKELENVDCKYKFVLILNLLAEM
jgi:hypothetical protein